MSIDLSDIPIIDHHMHALLRQPPQTIPDYQILFTESNDPEQVARHTPKTVFFRWAIRELAAFLACEPTVDGVLAARNAIPRADLATRCFADAHITTLLVDYGFGQDVNMGLDELHATTRCRVEPMLRLETMAQTLILQHDTFDQMLDAFIATVEAAPQTGHVALKSIIAYRTGLAITAAPQDEVTAAFAQLKEQSRQTGTVRLDLKPLCDFLVLQALEIAQRQELPIQFHTGFGDSDVDLLNANPLHLRAILQSERFNRVPFVLLHASYPYVRELAYLASIYPNVYADISLAIPFATSDIPSLLTQMLGQAPTSKVLFATDAYSIPELFWLAAKLGRWGLAQALEGLVATRLLTYDEAIEAGAQILHGNAQTLYGL